MEQRTAPAHTDHQRRPPGRTPVSLGALMTVWAGLAVVTLLVLPGAVAAKRGGRITIPIYDYTAQWQQATWEAVQGWDAALASRRIDLVYEAKPFVPCQELSQPTYGLVICEGIAAWAGTTEDGHRSEIMVKDGRVTYWGFVWIGGPAPEARAFAPTHLLCREIGLALGVSKDSRDPDSCVSEQGPPSGWSTAPSRDDAAQVLPGLAKRGKKR
jgi:hypothetical protein